MANKFMSVYSKEERQMMIDFLTEGNTIEELAEQLLNELPDSELDDIAREIKEQQDDA